MSGLGPDGKRILVLEPDRDHAERVRGILSRAGFTATLAVSARQALELLERRLHDAVLIDLDRAERERLLEAFREIARATPILLLVDAVRIAEAVRLLREGADDYVVRPADAFELRARLVRLLERHDLDSRLALLQHEVSKNYGVKNLVSRSPAMGAVLDRILRVAPLRATVLVFGESGVGKELVARAIHFNSPRRDFPFLAINCAAIPAGLIESELFGHEKGSFTGAHVRTRGKFETAHRGTLFLDEIGETDLSTQAKLLRVLEEKEFMRIGGDRHVRVDVRVIAATNADLEAMVESGAFRRDLYYRLKVVTIQVPPLRDRRSDIPTLVEAFLDELARANAVPRKSISPEALEALSGYQWPGNVRELKNILESVLVSSPGDRILPEDLPPSVLRERAAPARPVVAAGTKLEDMERDLIRATLEQTGGNRTHSAAMLGIGVRTLQRKIQSFGLEIASKRRRPRRRISVT
ncbi:MAG TPA: sigma-54 dependent transcriptional regulator [Candidatus Polarisedimenticolaceae bacterium]|nr:sigma-54 dependent transcriptional regulator [Candidatus Polarisedimenticolaceae bacterium]